MSKEESKNFVNRAKELSSDDEMVTMFDQENMREMIRNTELEEAHDSGVAVGIEQGSKEKAIEIAKNFIKMDLPDNVISEGVELPIEEIKALHKEAWMPLIHFSVQKLNY